MSVSRAHGPSDICPSPCVRPRSFTVARHTHGTRSSSTMSLLPMLELHCLGYAQHVQISLEKFEAPKWIDISPRACERCAARLLFTGTCGDKGLSNAQPWKYSGEYMKMAGAIRARARTELGRPQRTKACRSFPVPRTVRTADGPRSPTGPRTVRLEVVGFSTYIILPVPAPSRICAVEFWRCFPLCSLTGLCPGFIGVGFTGWLPC
ncbi:hypothetical protein AG1IA_06173 [Rhizoctonia solani AG-1 IA]|uniref:Uncharacterized protein n=1 Tax=Thanatephorus cucumeris (strain AG1-IA) TaxID=983506 RepID=L8WSV3_THACA|nr:hypothetical protein AG1IA_06173 [Rhizoctonia solani AG-1 IA]